MICPHCNAKWQEEMNMTRLATCPYCHQSLVQTLGTIRIQDFSLALASVALENGIEFLMDKPAATLGILADCTSSLEKERKMLRRFYECKIHELFRGVSQVPDYLINKAVRLLSEESLMSTDMCRYITLEFVKALGLEVISSQENVSEPQKKIVASKEAVAKEETAMPKPVAESVKKETASETRYASVTKKVPIEDRGIAPDAKRGNSENIDEILAEWNKKMEGVQVESDETIIEKLLKEKLPFIIKKQGIKLSFSSEISETELMHFQKAFKRQFTKRNILAIAYNNLILGWKIIFTDTMICTCFWNLIEGNRIEQIRYDNIADVKAYMLAGDKRIKLLDKEGKIKSLGITSEDFNVDGMVSLLKKLAGI